MIKFKFGERNNSRDHAAAPLVSRSARGLSALNFAGTLYLRPCTPSVWSRTTKCGTVPTGEKGVVSIGNQSNPNLWNPNIRPRAWYGVESIRWPIYMRVTFSTPPTLGLQSQKFFVITFSAFWPIDECWRAICFAAAILLSCIRQSKIVMSRKRHSAGRSMCAWSVELYTCVCDLESKLCHFICNTF